LRKNKLDTFEKRSLMFYSLDIAGATSKTGSLICVWFLQDFPYGVLK